MLKLISIIFLSLVSFISQAASIIMTGNFIKTAVSDNGTLGYGSSTSPGILHDSTGTGNFGIDDYLTPGTPYEGFSLKSDQFSTIANYNTSSSSGSISGSISDISATFGYDQAINFTGSYAGYFTISSDTYFNDGDERINISTTITAASNLSNLSFSRWLDPDPDVNTYSSFVTTNGRGSTSLPVENWVHAEGSQTGLTIGLFSDSSIVHNTGVSSGWSTDPSVYLSGQNDGNGDYVIGLGFNIGDLSIGESITLKYSYVMGGSLDTVDIPVPKTPSEVDLTPLEGNVNHISYFLLKINNPLSVAASVDYTTQDGSAIAGQDYIAVSGTATIPAGNTSTVVGVQIIGDTIAESNESFSLIINHPQGAKFPEGITSITATKTIIDDD